MGLCHVVVCQNFVTVCRVIVVCVLLALLRRDHGGAEDLCVPGRLHPGDLPDVLLASRSRQVRLHFFTFYEGSDIDIW